MPHGRRAAAAGALAALFAVAAMSQNAPAPPPSAPAPGSVPRQLEPAAREAQAPAPAAQPVEPPGMFEALGRWLDEGAANFRDNLRGAKSRMDELDSKAAADRKEFDEKAEEARKNAAEATKNAVDAVARIPVSRVMSGRERCTRGAQRRARLHRGRRYAVPQARLFVGQEPRFHLGGGMSAQLCMSGRQTADECTTVTFISRAMCER